MRYRYLLIILLTFFCRQATAAVFVVTSNADSGPGTLREALTKAAANGSAEKDYINFNLPDVSEAGRTINLSSALPGLSSNLVLDGSTQPGNKFGVSDAKVGLAYQPTPGQELSGLTVYGETDVEIYGLYVKNNTQPTPDHPYNSWYGIQLASDKNIKIGATGKGNVFFGFYEPLVIDRPDNTAKYFENLSVKSNFFGIDIDGKTVSAAKTDQCTLYFIIGDVEIGGTPAEGNVFAQGLLIYQGNVYDSTDPQDYYVSAPATINIKNNKIGVDYFVNQSFAESTGLNVESITPNSKNTVNIEDNVITAQSVFGLAIFVTNIGRDVTILRNYIGTDKTRQKLFKTGGIFLSWDTGQVAIGSSNTADANYITNCIPVKIMDYVNATVNKNSFSCSPYQDVMHYDGYGAFTFPVIQLTAISSTGISGTATPNSVIELFYSDKCGSCLPETYFASVNADANGKWSYSGPITGSVIASATFEKNTSNFTKAEIDVTNVKIINACDKTGSIIGAVPYNAKDIKWLDEQGNTAGTKADLLDVKPGKYRLLAGYGDCNAATNYFEIVISLQLVTTDIATTNPSCGNSNGAITGLSLINNTYGDPIYSWSDQNGKVWGNAISLKDVPAGQYKLTVTPADKSCEKTYGPVILKNTTGPNIDDSKPVIANTNCGQTTGAIKNILVTGGTGTRHFTWRNEQQQEVAITQDLTGQPAGKYTLQVTDGSSCGPVYSKQFEITEVNSITITESAMPPTPASCGKANGAVTGVTATGGTKYEWRDAQGNLAGSNPDLKNVPAGAYQLTVLNDYCQKQSQVYHVLEQPGTVYPSTYIIKNTQACYANTNGSLSLTADGLVKSYRWENDKQQNVGTNTDALNLPAGSYKLYLTDKNGCESYYNTYQVTESAQFKIADYGQKTDDKCGLKTGEIKNVVITGGLPPYTYSWINAAGEEIGHTSSIQNLAMGDYQLNVKDSRCGDLAQVFHIEDIPANINAPAVPDIQVCTPGYALLTVTNPATNLTYKLYDKADSDLPLDEKPGGRFEVSVTSNRSFFVSSGSGTCQSPKTEVKVSVGLSPLSIANTFTPNGDGHNDYWKIANIESYPAVVVQVFNRNGQKLFESKGYATPFNGTYNGKALPVGTYYYIINLNKNCNLLSGSLTILR